MAKYTSPLHVHVVDDSQVIIHTPHKPSLDNIRNKPGKDYENFFKEFRHSSSKYCSCSSHIHPRPWVPAPCLTSSSQQILRKTFNYSGSSSEEYLDIPKVEIHSDSVVMSPVYKNSNYNLVEDTRSRIAELYKEASILQESLQKIESGDCMSNYAKRLVRKWEVKPKSKDNEKLSSGRSSSLSPKKFPSSDQQWKSRSVEDAIDHPIQLRSRPINDSHQIQDLETSYRETLLEESLLKKELANLKKDSKIKEGLQEENKKLRRKVKKLAHRQKQSELRRNESGLSSIAAETRNEALVSDTSAFLALKKKYEDLLQYVLKVESDNKRLCSELENNFEGPSDHEHANDVRNRAIAAMREQLEILQVQLSEKNDYILACEDRLQHMTKLQHENKSLRDQLEDIIAAKYSSKSHSQDSTEQRWIYRLTETKEMYERAIDGYKEQLNDSQTIVEDNQRSYDQIIAQLRDQVTSLEQQLAVVTEKTDRNFNNSPIDNNNVLQPSSSNDMVLQLQNQISSLQEELQRSKNKNKEFEEYLQNSSDNIDGQRFINKISELENQVEHLNKELIVAVNVNSEKEVNIREYKELSDSLKKQLEEEQSNYQKLVARLNHSELMLQNHKEMYQKKTEDSLQNDSGQETYIPSSSKYAEDGEKLLNTLEGLVERLEVASQKDISEVQLSGIKDLFNTYLNQWRTLVAKEDSTDTLQSLQSENEKLKVRLHSKRTTLQTLEIKYQDVERQLKEIQERYANLEGKHNEVGSYTQNNERINDLESKFKEAQETIKRLNSQNDNLNQSLESLRNKLASEMEKTLSLQDQLNKLKEESTTTQFQKEDINNKIYDLQLQLNNKDELLEKTSAQLEERIRECTKLASDLEKAKNTYGREILQLRSTNSIDDYQQKFLDAQASVLRYQNEITSLKSEKDTIERNSRKTSRKYEEDVERLRLRNETLKKQMQSITATYHTMFGPNMNVPSIDLR